MTAFSPLKRIVIAVTGVVAATCLITTTALASSPADLTAPGDHVPASVDPADCDSIPPDRDFAVIETVHQVGVDMGASEKAMLAGFEAGWVESHMNNLPCGDKDSLGVFQQRPSQGWGTPEQIMDVTYASTKFFEQAIPNDSQNPDFTAGELAQSVQRSCCPERYDESEGKALEMLDEVRQARP